ncbi:MAG TPA: adenylate/guanylate cyclase domain-containing protein [Methylomirabilota bacterium]|jgi:class 3 adenylate cyclase|nr:adenylate/guanylate cyclase domain-containing protein [Methylomirabilota bacterium]
MSKGPTLPPTSTSSSTAYRCFLFADLRGYTAFIERAGNAAGVALLDDYLAITRSAVGQHHGAEIQTEGDGFYAVFPSASGAILCGLDIVRGAAKASADRADRPIRVGVGINAGEAVQTADGFIGSAVNVAARVCATASAGEVLVTATVRGITQASIPVAFTSRGRRRLKGVTDPVALYAVTTEGVPLVPDRRFRQRVLAGGILAAGVVAVAAALSLRPPTPGTSGSPSPASRPPALEVGNLDIGSHFADEFQPPFELVVSDLGWSVYRSGPEYLGLFNDSQPQGHVDIGRVEKVYQSPCADGGPTTDTGSTPLELMRALATLPYVTVSPWQPTTVGGHTGVSANVDISEGALAACGSIGSGDINMFPLGTETWRARPGERVRIMAVDVEGTRVTVMVSTEAAVASSVAELERFFERADRILNDLSF